MDPIKTEDQSSIDTTRSGNTVQYTMFTIQCSSACVLLGALLTIIANVACDYDENQAARSLTNGNALCAGGRCIEQTGNGISGAMWFGPRLGRKRRSDEKVETSDEDVSAIADAINAGPWNFVTYQGVGDKRHTTQFTPRLGRELTDDFLQKYMDYTLENNRLARLLESQDDSDMQRQLPPPQYAPRLGRHLAFNTSPRLGRRLRFTRKASE